MNIRRASNTATCDTPAAGESAPSGLLDLRQLSRYCQQIPGTAADESEATDRLVRLAQQLTQAESVVYFALDSTGQLAADPCSQTPEAIGESTLNQLYLLARRAHDTELAQPAQLKSSPPCVAMSVPVPRRDGRVEALVVVTNLSPDDRRTIAGVLQVAQLVAAFAGQWRGGFDQVQAAGRAQLLGRLVQATASAAQAEHWKSLCEIAAHCLAEISGARLVALGVRRRGDICRVTGMSPEYPASPGAPLIVAIETALAETFGRTGHQALESLRDADSATDATGQLESLLRTQNLYRVLLTECSGRVMGAVLIVCDSPLGPAERTNLREACEFLGPQLARLKQARLPWWRRGRNAFDRLTPRARRNVLACAAGALVLLFAVPFPDHVKCRCDVQPVTRRFIGAPYEGRLQDALVEPGDFVRAGQTLAVMDGREIRLQLSGVEAELQRVTKQRDRALANRETAAAQIALLEMQRLQSERQLYADRLANLELRSPTDGVVISGDPQKLKGARLTIGQTLLEVGPLGEMVLEVAIPDERIAQVQNNTPVRFRLDAMPRSSLHGQLRRIYPRSELRDAQNVFIAEVDIVDDTSALRPGMRGYAKLSAGRRSLFSAVFRRAIDQLLFHLGW